MATDYQRLFEAVERKAGRQMQTPRDFQWLEKRIFEDIHETISASTLMRLWGYRAGGVPRQTTLDVLARYVGFEDYVQFCKAPSPLPPDPTKPPLKGEASSFPKPSRSLWLILLLLAVVGGFALWHFTRRAPMEEGLPAGAKDMTKLIANPTCDPDKLDAWTFEHGGVTLAEDSTLMYYMKNFDVWQVIHGLPAGEYELRVKAWQLPDQWDAARYNYEHAEDKEEGCAGTNAEIYAGPFAQHVRNYVSMTKETWRDSSDVRLRFVCLDDSVRIGFRANSNNRYFSLALADDFRLFQIRKAKSKEELQELAALRDSAQTVDDARPHWKIGDKVPTSFEGRRMYFLFNYPKNSHLVDLWKGYEEPLPEGWITEQDEGLCHLVHRSDVGRGCGDSDIYMEYLSKKPAKPGLLMGLKVNLEPGRYCLSGCFFAQNEKGALTNVRFAVKGIDGSIETSPMMAWHYISCELHEPKEVIVGLWAPEGSDVSRAGICMTGVWKE